MMLVGLTMLAFVTVLYSEALLAGRYRAGRWIDVLWVIAFLAFGFGAREERSVVTLTTPPIETSPRLAAFVPTVALVLWMGASLTSDRSTLFVVNVATGTVLAVGFYVRVWATQRLIAKEEARAWKLEASLARVQKLEAVGMLAGGVAHDFNNLLMAATASLKLARRRIQRGDSVTRDLDEIDAVLWRAADLTSRLLDLARKREPKRVVIDPREALERVRVLLDKVVPRNIELSVVCDPDVPAIVVDPADLDHALLNLGVNARDALRERGGKLTLRLRRGRSESIDGTAVMIEIHDDGPGIPADVLPRVFEPFFTTKSEHGTGLGLAMVEAFASSSKGVVSVTSTPGDTTFRLAFPAATAIPVETKHASTSKTVLVVSREDASGLAMAGALERAGIAAVVARDTAMALSEVSRRTIIDAVVVDAGPEQTGRDSVRELRAAGVSAAFVLVASVGADESGEWNAVVTKPYEARVLVEEVERATAKHVAGSEAAR
jgi:signal transduction histidine kinase/CheY-like chemotaxis protein